MIWFKQVRAKIDELGITYVYYQFIFCERVALWVKGIPARHWERTAAKGFQTRIWLKQRT